MGALDKFLANLINYDKEHINPDIIKELVSKYLKDPEFDPDFVASKSSAAAGLCSWVINIHAFHEVWSVVLPKRLALEQANQELAAARAKLVELKNKLLVMKLSVIKNSGKGIIIFLLQHTLLLTLRGHISLTIHSLKLISLHI